MHHIRQSWILYAGIVVGVLAALLLAVLVAVLAGTVAIWRAKRKREDLIFNG